MTTNDSSSEKTSVGRIIQFGGALVGTLVGSGFASGQEVMQFFTVYGSAGIWGALLTTVMFAYMGAALMYYGYKFATSAHFSAFRHYLGKHLGMFMDIFAVMFCFLVCIIMVSGAGAMMNQYFGLPTEWGSILMAVIALLSALLGLDRIVKLLGAIGPIAIAFLIIISVYTFVTHWGNLANADAMVAAAEEQGGLLRGVEGAGFAWLIAAINYVAHNIIAGVPFISKLGTQAHTKKEALWGGVLGGIFLGLCAIALNLAMLSTFSEVYALEVPGLQFAQMLSPAIGAVFAIILLIMIYNTVVPMMISVANLFVSEEKDPTKYRVSLVALAVIVLIGGQFQFSTLINIIYPFVGYFGMIYMVVVIVQYVRWRFMGAKEPTE